MKRVPRNALKFEPLAVFASVALDNNYKLQSNTDVDQFLQDFGASLKASLINDTMLHGKRVEAMFAHVAGALGSCAMIKQEDSGSVFVDGKNLQAPDYCLVLKDGTRFFVEVKNCHLSDPTEYYKIRKDYVERLENYAAMQGSIMKFAIFFSRSKKWLLISKELMTERRHDYAINLIEAMAKSEMAMLGDRMIGTRPNLSIELIAKLNEEASLSQTGKASIVIGDVKFYSDGTKIESDLDKNIAFYLMRFGTWTTGDPSLRMSGDRIESIVYEFYPDVPWEEEQGFAFVGLLSEMIANAYAEHTVLEQRVVALDIKLDPSVFSVKIPKEYKSDKLPLWQLELQSNPDFRMLEK